MVLIFYIIIKQKVMYQIHNIYLQFGKQGKSRIQAGKLIELIKYIKIKRNQRDTI